MKNKLALGKGAAALFGDLGESNNTQKKGIESTLLSKSINEPQKEMVPTNEPLLVDITTIVANPAQPRKIFKESGLKELSESIKENGIIQPLIVTKTETGFELIAGERRLRASIMAGIEKVPVIVKRATDKDKMVMAIIENVQRSDLNCVEEGLAYFQLMDEYKLTQEEVAKKIGKDRSSVANFLRILKLPRPVIELLQKDQLSFGHAKVLGAVKEREDTIKFAKICVSEELSVRELEALIKKGPKNNTPREAAPTKDLSSFKQQLEQKTGFHFDLKSKKNGKGQIVIKFNSDAEFNDIYEYLLKN